ncbi:MAG: 5-methyltetrahydropteroyltriglutamate--homocysteine S-methyltransferase [Alphaproteobacteria bacterium]|nr:5-methyltetrahydropteroyltriglutamate--homocysteine S-methyltransferase [Alphaproteobacteria bacterium]
MVLATVLGFPRIGKQRELKTALERYWKGKIGESDLRNAAADLRAEHWRQQKAAGLDVVPTGDFSFYDQMLDMTALLGAIPPRYGWTGEGVDLATFFAMARGAQREGVDVQAMEMTKWFDTNYHYIVPEFAHDQKFKISSTKPVDEFLEARRLGFNARPVLIGPITYLLLGKKEGGGNLALLDTILPAYAEILQKLEQAGAAWIQLDEPALVLDLDAAARAAYAKAYAYLRQATKAKLFVATYFGALGDNLDAALALPVDALHLDLVRAPQQLDSALDRAPTSLTLSLGVVDGRNVWRNDLGASLRLLETAAARIGKDRVWVSASCSLLHAPYDLDLETTLDPEIKNWLAFAQQKLGEITTLTRGLNEGRGAIADALDASDAAVKSRANSPRIHNPAVAARLIEQPLASAGRKSPFATRSALQKKRLGLPLFPTTTIGSFPQTAEVRKHRADFKNGKVTPEAYDAFLKAETQKVIRFQEDIGLDVLVHGEFERSDMVEYFGEQFSGFAFTQNGWVQSYGSRCVKPPIIYGDVARPRPITVSWSRFAQSLTEKPVKGMLTGPVTILQWSFVRDDQPRSVTAHQIALALQDEVLDLEKAGIRIIQIDEPAFREGLPLRRAEWQAYLTWAAQAFRLASTGLKDDTQIQTHMCYAEFNDIIAAIASLDADVILIETSRSQRKLLEIFTAFKYPNEIGPGVYDIHSPRVPSEEEMIALLEKASTRIAPAQLWVNPDCGLKTREWPETKASLEKMVAAARRMRERHAGK